MDNKSNVIVLGIDPGVRGGFALVKCSVSHVNIDGPGGDCFDGEVISARAGQWFHKSDSSAMIDLRQRNVVRCGAVRDFLVECFVEDLVEANEADNFVIERQHARISQGANGQIMFNYGRLVEQCEIEIDARDHGNLFIADPSKWKPQMGLNKDKSASLRLATEIFGAEAGKLYWPRKGDDGVAEAALLAFWRGKRILS